MEETAAGTPPLDEPAPTKPALMGALRAAELHAFGMRGVGRDCGGGALHDIAADTRVETTRFEQIFYYAPVSFDSTS